MNKDRIKNIKNSRVGKKLNNNKSIHLKEDKKGKKEKERQLKLSTN